MFWHAEAVVTHFSCGTDQAALKCTAQYLPLAFGLFESLLGARFPYRALQQVFMPAGFGAGRPIAAAALQLLPAHLLIMDRCVEQAGLPSTVNHLSIAQYCTPAKQAAYLVECPRTSFGYVCHAVLAVFAHGECAADRSDLLCVHFIAERQAGIPDQSFPSALPFFQAIEARQAIVRELARQWFGIFLRPKAPADAWLLQGLAGWLEDQFVKLYMGRNEQAFRYCAARS